MTIVDALRMLPRAERLRVYKALADFPGALGRLAGVPGEVPLEVPASAPDGPEDASPASAAPAVAAPPRLA